MMTFFLRTLRGRMILYYCTIFIIFIGLLGGATYQLFMNMMLHQIMQYTEKIIDEKKTSIDSYFSQVVNLVQIAAASQVLRDAIDHRNNPDNITKLYDQRQVSDLFTNIIRFNSKIKDFFVINDQGYIFTQSGATVYNDYNFLKQPWFQKRPDDYFHVYFQPAHPQDYYVLGNNGEGDVVSVIAPINDLNGVAQGQKVYLLCNLNVKEIESISNETRLEQSGYITILDQNNKQIYKPTSAHIDISQELASPAFYQKEKGTFTLGKGTKRMSK